MTLGNDDSLAMNAAGAGRMRPASQWLRPLATLAGVLIALFVFGFALFATVVMREPTPLTRHADGIIVLTGGDFRILEGGRLLNERRAGRLLISGVNPVTSRDDLLKLSGIDTATFNCCVELGYSAQDTVGNAEEARAWVSGQRIKSLIVVTSSYHMPRSLAELALAMPGVELIPHAVVPRKFRNREWWLQPTAARLMLSEYVKFLPVAARLQAVRYVKPLAAPVAAEPCCELPPAGSAPPAPPSRG